MSPEKVYTAFYAYYATRGGVCTLRRGARAARGCAGDGGASMVVVVVVAIARAREAIFEELR